MSHIQQFAQGAHQLGDVVEMQAGGGFIEHEQSAAPGDGLTARARAFGSVGQKPSQLETLRLAAAERGHRLAQLHVFQTYINNGLQPPYYLAIMFKKDSGFADGQVQHVGDVDVSDAGGWPRGFDAQRALNRDLQDFRAVAFAIAVRAAQVNVAQELHFHMFEARSAAGGAAAVAIVEAEFGRGVAALARQRGIGKNLTDRIPGTDVAHRVGARRFADRGLVHKDHVTELLGAQQALEGARGLGRLAKMPFERRCQDVLDQG